MEKQQNSKPIEKMSQKELKALCLEQRDKLETQKNKIDSLNKIIERMTNERIFEEDQAEKSRKEAANIRARAIGQADDIIADAKVAAEKIIECARTSVYESKPEEIELPGAKNLDLSGLLSNSSDSEPNMPENPTTEAVVEDVALAKEMSAHERILADYF